MRLTLALFAFTCLMVWILGSAFDMLARSVGLQ